MNNRHAIKELFISEEEAVSHNKSIMETGPTPGVYHLAKARTNLNPDFSFKRVGIKSTILKPQRFIFNQTLDSSEGFLTKQEKSAATLDQN